ncbi:hypothetical protein ScalyP_jg11576 [Parmales sp. scaly parma]|nr:hypothetical protein ScalyP_jg11576 [Parmales sp. scaly parma]
MTVSDGHDQMFVQLREFKLTQNLYGLPLPTHFSTDNVTNDRPFFLEMFPGARAKQTQYDNNQIRNHELSKPEYNAASVEYLNGSLQQMEAKCDLAYNHLKEQTAPYNVVAVDAEWVVHLTNCGFVGKVGKVALIQLSYYNEAKQNQDARLACSGVPETACQSPKHTKIHPCLWEERGGRSRQNRT